MSQTLLYTICLLKTDKWTTLLTEKLKNSEESPLRGVETATTSSPKDDQGSVPLNTEWIPSVLQCEWTKLCFIFVSQLNVVFFPSGLYFDLAQRKRIRIVLSEISQCNGWRLSGYSSLKTEQWSLRRFIANRSTATRMWITANPTVYYTTDGKCSVSHRRKIRFIRLG